MNDFPKYRCRSHRYKGPGSGDIGENPCEGGEGYRFSRLAEEGFGLARRRGGAAKKFAWECRFLLGRAILRVG
jgi:hypothetical protein